MIDGGKNEKKREQKILFFYELRHKSNDFKCKYTMFGKIKLKIVGKC